MNKKNHHTNRVVKQYSLEIELLQIIPKVAYDRQIDG